MSILKQTSKSKANGQERPHARLRDYLTIAPTLGVSHMLAFSLTDAANVHMRVARLPQGPTLTFRVQRFSLVKYVFPRMKWTELLVGILLDLH